MKVVISTTLPAELKQELDEHLYKHRLKFSHVIQKLVMDYLKKEGKDGERE